MYKSQAPNSKRQFNQLVEATCFVQLLYRELLCKLKILRCFSYSRGQFRYLACNFSGKFNIVVIDLLSNSNKYSVLGTGIAKAFEFLKDPETAALMPGKYHLDGDKLFAIVQEYETLDSATEQMESHRKYIDVQYVISGEEMVGLALLKDQQVSKEYSDAEDFILYADAPEFYTSLSAGMFMIFYPTDPHMPCLRVDGKAGMVKKVVVKVAVE